LAEAIAASFSNYRPDTALVETAAQRIYAASELGRDKMLPHARDASEAATIRQIIDLQKLAGKLAAHLHSLNAPALAALAAEGLDVAATKAALLALTESARCAEPGTDEGETAGADHEAAEVTVAAAHAYYGITSKAPTVTTCAVTNLVKGAWPGFLGSLFDVLQIRASVEHNVKQFRRRTPPDYWAARED
jgi:hypothetical protein